MQLRVVQTSPKLILEWDPVPGAKAGYRGKAGGIDKWTQTQGTRMTFAKDATGIVIQALGVEDEGTHPPTPSDAYFVNDYSTQDFRTPWTTLFSYASPGWLDVSGAPSKATPDGRVGVTPDPDGSGYAARIELRDSDPGWAGTTMQKSEVRTVTQQTMNKSTVSVGDVRWFSTRIWLPDNAQERFEWPTSGADTFFTILDLHPGSNSMGGAVSLTWYAGSKWATFRLNGGTPPGGAAESVPLWRLVNDDGSRYAPSYNRWIDLVFGVRFAPDSTGWFEAWVDGVNVYPRKNRPTMWGGDTGVYLKHGLYKVKAGSLASGRSVIYFGRTTIGYSKP